MNHQELGAAINRILKMYVKNFYKVKQGFLSNFIVSLILKLKAEIKVYNEKLKKS